MMEMMAKMIAHLIIGRSIWLVVRPEAAPIIAPEYEFNKRSGADFHVGRRTTGTKATLHAVAVLAAVIGTTAFAEDESNGRRPSPPTQPSWEFAITAYPTDVRDGENYTSAIAAADRGPLHIEARYNYESIGARSAFVGWTFSGGEDIKWELTPLLGGAWGTTKAFVPGLEASAAWRRVDFYVEAEYVRDNSERSDSYFYAWSELGFRPVEWLRVGVAGQRTKAYGGDRDIQRGPFGQITWGPVTIGGYWFNPGSRDQVFVGSIGATF